MERSLAEQLTSRERYPAAPRQGTAKPVLSRYARQSRESTEEEDATAGEPAAVGDSHPVPDAAVLGNGVEISPRTHELPVALEDEAAADPESTASRTGEAEPAPHTEPASVEPPAPVEARSGAVRRVEADEVREAERAGEGWVGSAVTVRDEAIRDHSGAGAGKKLPFWKRLAMPLVQGSVTAPRVEGAKPASLEPVLARLSALEKQLAANQAATEGQLTRFEENITRLWELEEQLTITEVRERLALLEANQEEVADGLHSVGRNLTLLAVVMAAALAAGLLALGLLL